MVGRFGWVSNNMENAVTFNQSEPTLHEAGTKAVQSSPRVVSSFAESETLLRRAEIGSVLDDELSLPPTYAIHDVRDWLFRNFGSHERLPCLIDLFDDMEPDNWLRLLGEVWPTVDNVGIHKDQLIDALLEMEINIESVITALMNPEEYSAFEALAEQITIYRGCGPRNRFGFSWTLDRDIATKFPFMSRYKTDQPILLTATIPKNRVAALKSDRDEQEVIVFDYEGDPSLFFTEEPILVDPSGQSIAQ